MVSIPDWARFARMLDNKPTASSTQSRYHRQREEEVIRQAEEHGYFLKPSKSFLEENFAPEEERTESRQSVFKSLLDNQKKNRDLNQVFLIKLTHSHVRGLGDIGMCNNLTICILSNNYLTRFDALQNCVNLMKLDLHSNQVSILLVILPN